MSRRTALVVIVCVAIVAFTAIAAVPMFAVLDARTPVDALFSTPPSAPAPVIDDVPLPASPAVDIPSPRAPPHA